MHSKYGKSYGTFPSQDEVANKREGAVAEVERPSAADQDSASASAKEGERLLGSRESRLPTGYDAAKTGSRMNFGDAFVLATQQKSKTSNPEVDDGPGAGN